MNGVSGNRYSQRGAALIIATVFLLIVIALFGGIGLRMAGSDITDTAVQNDSVEALFIAESGLERAAQKLAAGTACGAVAEIGTHGLGRGDFQIETSNTVGSLCRVQVRGRVLIGASVRAERVIQGDISLSSGGCRGFAVGNASGGEVMLCWNGSSWTRSGPYAAIPNVTLNSVACPTANDCWAVGNRSGGELIARWNGTTWTRWPVSAIPNQNLLDVHCVDINNCWAVGNNRTFAVWNGVTWSPGTTAGGFPNVAINSVHCVTATDCWAVGNRAGGNAVIARWTGGPSWTRVLPLGGIPNVNLQGITCAAANDCWAVGNPSGGEVILRWTGTWTRMSTTINVPDQILRSVSCVNGNECWATGDREPGGALRGEVLARWTVGLAWLRLGPYAGVPDVNLRGIHMVSALEGYSVGVSGRIANWNGSIWNNQASPVASQLNAVAMAPAGSGSVAVQRWREIIN